METFPKKKATMAPYGNGISLRHNGSQTHPFPGKTGGAKNHFLQISAAIITQVDWKAAAVIAMSSTLASSKGKIC